MAASPAREQPVLHRVECRRRPRGHADLAVDALDVMVDRLGREVEPPPHLLRGQARRRRGAAPRSRAPSCRRAAWPRPGATAGPPPSAPPPPPRGQSCPSRASARSRAAAASADSAWRCGRSSRAVWKASAAARMRAAGDRSGPVTFGDSPSRRAVRGGAARAPPSLAGRPEGGQRPLAVIGMKLRRIALARRQRPHPHPGRHRHDSSPMSWISPAQRSARTSASASPISRPALAASSATAREWPWVKGMRMSIMSAMARKASSHPASSSTACGSGSSARIVSRSTLAPIPSTSSAACAATSSASAAS